ncbi:MAG: LysR family transcriptional regulator [Clostridiales bacterium]|nr:LysR family transcriptional regulator [Clostridiales bacterium]
MNLRDIKTFLKLAELRNFGKTAEELFISQTAVSARIRSLETELNTSLFIRSTHYVILTSAGRQFLPYAKSIASTMESAKQELVFYNNFDMHITIAAPESIWDTAFVNTLSMVVESHREIYFKFLCDHSSNILPKILDHSIDIGFTLHPPYHNDIRTVPICRSRYLLLCSPGLALPSDRMTAENIGDFPFINMHWGKDFEAWFSGHYPVSAYRMAVDQTSILTKFLLNGNGIAFMPERYASEYLSEGTLVSIPFEYSETLPDEECCAAYLAGNANILLPIIHEINNLLDKNKT